MRNLKRALSLALASVMLMGMMVVGSSAASFPDVDDQDHVKAIEVLSAVGVIVGDNGNFRPDDSVSRNEMAVIMAKLILGTYEADSYVGSHPFTDVPSWASRYVAACYNSGIISGRGEGIYDGNSTVTAVEAAAMMLRALGYEDLSKGASQWDQPVAAKANEISLFAGLSGASNTPMDRNSVAKLALNTLQATMVTTERSGQDITLPDGTTIASARNYTEVESDKDGYAKAIDQTPGSKTGTYTVQLGEKLYDGKLKLDNSEPDDFGRTGGLWKLSGKEICFSADTPTATFTDRFTYKDLYNALGSALVKDIQDGNAIVTYWLDGDDDADGLYSNNTEDADYGLDDLYADRTKTDKHLGDRGMLVEVYVNDDNDKVDVVMVETYLAQVEGDYDKDDEELELNMLTGAVNDETLKLEDFGNLADFSDEDYVLVTVANGEIKSIALAEIVTANVDKYTKNTSVTLDGTAYNYNKNFYNTVAGNTNKDMTYDINENAVVIMDGYGFIIGLKEAEGSSDYVFINAFDDEGRFSSTTYLAEAFFTDGTKDTITLDKVDGKGIASRPSTSQIVLKDGGATKGPGWYTYTKTSSDKYRLTSETNVGGTAFTSTGLKVVENGKVNIRYDNTAANIVRANNSTVFLVNDDDDISVFTGVKDAPTVTTAAATPDTVLWAAKDGSYATYVYVEVGNGSFDGATTDSGDIVYIYDTTYDTEEDAKDEFYTFDAIVNGKKDKISTNDHSVFRETGLYYKVRRDSNDLVDSVRAVADGTDDYVKKTLTNATIEQKGKTVIFNQGTPVELYLADGAPIWVIEGDEATKVTATKLANDFASGKAQITTGTVWASVKDDEATGVYVAIGSKQAAIPVTMDPAVDTALGNLTAADKKDEGAPVTLTSSQSGNTITFTVSNLKTDKTAAISYDDGTAARAAKTVTTRAADAEGVATAEIRVDSAVTKVKVTNIVVGDSEPEAHEHTWTKEGNTKEATCTEAGSSEYYVCNVDGCPLNKKHYKTQGTAEAAGTEFGVGEENPAATGHTMGAKQNGTPATCESTGTKDYYTCSKCSKSYLDENGATEMTDENKVLDALGHDFEAGTDANAGKCVCKNDNNHTHNTYSNSDGNNKPDVEGCTVCEAAGMAKA